MTDDVAVIGLRIANKHSTGLDLAIDIKNAILAERERCAAIADKWAADDMQKPESRLVGAYINREILKP